MRCIAAYAYSAAGYGESTTDMAWDGQAMVHEMGDLLAESARFGDAPEIIYADIDAQRLRLERMRNGTFNDTAEAMGHPEQRFRKVAFEAVAAGKREGLYRPVRRFPFVPADPARLDADCYEAFNIQVEGLVTRFRATSGKHLVIGVSGGLDSTHAHHRHLSQRRGRGRYAAPGYRGAGRDRRRDRYPSGGAADAGRHGPSLCAG